MNEDNNNIFNNNNGGYSTPSQEPRWTYVPPQHMTAPQPETPSRPAAEPSAPAQPAETVWTGYESAAKPAAEKKTRRPMSTGAIIALFLVCAVVVSILSAGATYLLLSRGDRSVIGNVVDSIAPTPVPVIPTYVADGALNETANAIYELAKQQVVGISTEITYYNVFGQSTAASVTGSGVIITADGYILTNYHVVEDAHDGGYQARVMLYDETAYDAEIVGFDKDNDIALLKIDAQGLNPAQLGESESLVVGQTVYAVGNPLGELAYTMTSGMVSATDRTITTENDVAINMFQIDAAVNSGNSGGPVYNTNGQVIGIVTAKYSNVGVEGIGFAIPISEAAHIVNQILEFGYVKDRAAMGVVAVTVTPSVAEYYHMVEGAYLNQVNAGSAAEKAGLQVGDIITAVDDKPVAGSSELTSIVRQYHAGDTAQITLTRGGEEMTLTIVFDERQPDPDKNDDTQQGQASGEMPGGGQYYSGDLDDFFRQFFNFGFGR